MSAQEIPVLSERTISASFEAMMSIVLQTMAESQKAVQQQMEAMRVTLAAMLELLQVQSVTKQQAADLIGVSYGTVINMLSDGRLTMNPAGNIPLTVIRDFQAGKRAKQVLKKGRGRA
jgi:DNA-directed RNA polymerase specialized sigma24 family protein